MTPGERKAVSQDIHVHFKSSLGIFYWLTSKPSVYYYGYVIIFLKIKYISIFSVLYINSFFPPILNISCKMKEKMIQLIYH